MGVTSAAMLVVSRFLGEHDVSVMCCTRNFSSDFHSATPSHRHAGIILDDWMMDTGC